MLSAPTCEEKYDTLMSDLNAAIYVFLQEKIVKRHPTDHPWMTTNIKTAIRKRQLAFLRHGKESVIYKFWRNKLQQNIRSVKRLFYQNKVADIERTSPKCWWKSIKKMAGITTKSEWHYQFVNETTDVRTLANTINDYFIRLTLILHPLSILAYSWYMKISLSL